ncbi:MAG TPA: cupredoxin domain-containing protein [Polyangiaceae bacterium]|nr:cupredoxin domain-containing protein [Polyangiaceae bacterium]
MANPGGMGKALRHPTVMFYRLATLVTLVLPLLSGCRKDEAGGTPKPVVAVGDQVIAVTADERGFTPAAVETQHGSKLTLRFTRTTDATCADKVVFPEVGIEQVLPLKQPVDVIVPTDKARTLAFQCGMGMFKSAVLIR